MDEMVEKVFKSQTLTGEINSVEQTAAVFASGASGAIAGWFTDIDRGQARY